jgi:protein ECT2
MLPLLSLFGFNPWQANSPATQCHQVTQTTKAKKTSSKPHGFLLVSCRPVCLVSLITRCKTHRRKTVQQFGLFKFRTGGNSLPSTPTANKASRASIFGLDVISRNLFGSKQGSSMGDIFNGSVNGRKRSKSTTSRSSIYTQTTSTGDDSLTKFSRRSNSTATAATTVSITDDDSLGTRRSNSKSRKLLKRSKSPAPSENELDKPSPSRRLRAESAPPPRSQRDERGSEDGLDAESHARVLHKMDMDESEWDLTMRLELARKNSNQHGKQATSIAFEKPLEETIYEGKNLFHH